MLEWGCCGLLISDGCEGEKGSVEVYCFVMILGENVFEVNVVVEVERIVIEDINLVGFVVVRGVENVDIIGLNEVFSD